MIMANCCCEWLLLSEAAGAGASRPWLYREWESYSHPDSELSVVTLTFSREQPTWETEKRNKKEWISNINNESVKLADDEFSQKQKIFWKNEKFAASFNICDRRYKFRYKSCVTFVIKWFCIFQTCLIKLENEKTSCPIDKGM